MYLLSLDGAWKHYTSLHAHCQTMTSKTRVRLFVGLGGVWRTSEVASFEVDESTTTGEDLERLIWDILKQKLPDLRNDFGFSVDVFENNPLFLVFFTEMGTEIQLNKKHAHENWRRWKRGQREKTIAGNTLTLDDKECLLKKGGPFVKEGEFGIHVYYGVEIPNSIDREANFFSRPNNDKRPVVSPDGGSMQGDDENRPLAYFASFPAVRFVPPSDDLVLYEGEASRYGLSPSTAENVAGCFFCVKRRHRQTIVRSGDPLSPHHYDRHFTDLVVDGRCRWTGRELQWHPSTWLVPENTYSVRVNLEVFRKGGLVVRGYHTSSMYVPELKENGKYFQFKFTTRAAEPLSLFLHDENGKRRKMRYYAGESYGGLKATVARRLGVAVERVLGLSIIGRKGGEGGEVAGDVVDDKDVLDLQEGNLIRVEWREDASLGENVEDAEDAGGRGGGSTSGRVAEGEGPRGGRTREDAGRGGERGGGGRTREDAEDAGGRGGGGERGGRTREDVEEGEEKK